MKYEQMLLYLKTGTETDLAKDLNIPVKTLHIFLKNNGYKKDSILRTTKRPRSNAIDIYGEAVPYSPDMKLSDLQKEIIHGTLFGDSGVYWSVENKNAYLKSEHAWNQIGYLKAKIELLKPHSFNPYIDPPFGNGLQDYQVGFSCHASKELASFRDEFYIERVADSRHLQKNIMQINLWKKITPISMAFWIMDDGKKYGKGFSIPIGKQSYYNRKMLEDCVMWFNDNWRFDLKIYEGENCYSIGVNKGSRIIDWVRPYIFPYFFYKLDLMPDDCGSFYNKFKWYNDLKHFESNLTHPHIEKNPYSKTFFVGLKGNQAIRYERAVFSQVRARGFPYVVIPEEERTILFNRLKEKIEVLPEDGVLPYNNFFNKIANSFMNHRYKLRVKNNRSPYEIFCDTKRLKKVLLRQLRAGPAINNSNIRAALSVYGGQAVGQFNTLYAKIFCDHYCVTSGKILDPCAGFGSRLIGCVSSGRDYYGVEPSSETYKGLINIKNWVSEKAPQAVEIIKGCFEDLTIPSEEYDMAITSPPYFNLEEYSMEETQSYIRYPVYEVWLEKFLKSLIIKVFNSLKQGGVFLLNIDRIGKYDLISDALKIAQEVGFFQEKIYFSSSLTRPGTELTSEPYIVLRKV